MFSDSDLKSRTHDSIEIANSWVILDLGKTLINHAFKSLGIA